MGRREDKTKIKKNAKLKIFILRIFLIFFLMLIFFSIYYFINWKIEGNKILKLQEEVLDFIATVDSEDYITYNAPDDTESDYYYYINFPFINANIDELKKINSDTVGFINVSSTNINYPVLQSIDNSYYLTHAFDKSKNKAGWVFLDYRCSLDDLKDNTIIYGHNRGDGVIFGTLKNLLTDSWQEDKDNYVIRVSSENYNYAFQIFSIYTIDNEDYYIKTSFQSDEEKKIWVNKMKERNISIIDTEVSSNDKILTLSTCKNTSNGKRIVVQAKLIKMIEKNEVTITEE